MSITVRSPFKAAPRISKTRFLDVLQERGSYQTPLFNGIPFEDRRSVMDAEYDRIAARGHDPAVILAIGVCEHGLGTDEDSVLWRNDTRSLTNARSVRDPSIDGAVVIKDRVRKSNYVKYQTVIDSIQDGMYRVDEPGYAYRKANAVSIIDHTMIWTEGDGPQYAARMVALINAWMTEDTEEPPMAAQIPGFEWLAADNRHHTKGRTQRIRGGAQHYSAGTDSRGWLTTSADSNVSANFLVKHTPKLDDRGWQLVRIEDTPHTTAYANPYTVSIEYEHRASQSVPDIAYEVLAQTWADIDAYLDARPQLGNIELIAGHKTWVANPELICPDGVDVARIVRRFNELRTPAKPPLPPRNPLEVWSATLDPWNDSNPYARGREPFYIEDRFLPRMRADFMRFGYVVSGAMLEPDTAGVPRLVQYTERVRMEIQPDGSYTEGLTGLEALRTRYPHLVAA